MEEEMNETAAESEPAEDRGLIYRIAPRFSVARRYVEGALAVYGGRVYRCVCGHYGAWTPSDFEETTVEEALSGKAFQCELAPAFRLDADYSEGCVATKEGKMVECVGAGRGLAAAFVDVTVSTLIDRMRARLEHLSLSLESLCSRMDRLSSRSASSSNGEMLDFLAPGWASGVHYRDGELVRHDGALWICSCAHKSGSSFDGSMWATTTVADALCGIVDAFSDAMRAKADK